MAEATEGIVEVEDRVGMADIMVAMADIMAEAISTEDPASTSVDTLGTPTTIRTGIILDCVFFVPYTLPMKKFLLIKIKDCS